MIKKMLPPGTRFGVYDIVAPIGEGGMGVIYRARDVRLNRDVALKMLPENRVADSGAIARFRFEAQAASALNHPHILTSEIFGDEPSPVRICACDPPQFFPTPPPANATPNAPPPGSKDALQAALYVSRSAGPGRIPLMLRYRVRVSRQTIRDKDRRSRHERSRVAPSRPRAERKTGANFHLVVSPQSARSGAGGWETRTQIVLFVERGIVVPIR